MAGLAGYKAVAVVEEGGTRYHFAIYDDGNEYMPGDCVIVSCSGNGNYCQYKWICEIITPEESAEEFSKNITAEVIGKANAYFERKEKRKEADKIKKKMDALTKKIDAQKKYEFYASENEEFGELYKEYKKLLG